MCDICTNYAHEYDIQFNTAKCQLIKYGEFDDVPFFISIERRSSMNDMVFILVIQLARLPIVMVRDVARDFLTHLNGILANFNHCEFCK